MIERRGGRGVAVVLAAITIAFAGCGGENDDKAGETTTTAADATPTTGGGTGGGNGGATVDLTCPLTAAEVGDVVDLELAVTYKSASECGFQPDGTPAFRAPAVHYHVFPASLSLEEVREELGYTDPVDGVGDEAYTGPTAVGPTGSGTGLLVRAGDRLFEIYVDLEQGDDAHATVARELATLVLAKL